MSTVYEAKEEMHRIEARLYPYHLLGGENTYVAKTMKEKTIGVEAVCAAMKNRAGYDGSHEEAVSTVRCFFKEMMYQLCDGFSVNTGWFTIAVHIGGLFHSLNEGFDPKKHRVSFKFHMLKAMRNLASTIEVVINSRAWESAWIAEYTDLEEHSTNANFSDGNIFCITGRHLKLEGDDPSVGVYFVPVLNPAAKVKASRIAENTASKIMGIAPDSGYARNRVEIHTQYSGSGSARLKSVRVIPSPFELNHVK